MKEKTWREEETLFSPTETESHAARAGAMGSPWCRDEDWDAQVKPECEPERFLGYFGEM